MAYTPINQSINQSINRSIDQSINRSINKSINQSTDLSINQSLMSVSRVGVVTHKSTSSGEEQTQTGDKL